MIFKRIILYSIPLLFSILLFILCQNYNLGVSPDSVYYIEMAKQLSMSKSIELSIPEYTGLWPVLYPLLLSATSIIFKTSVIKSGLFLNTFLVFLLGYVVIGILKHFNIKYYVIVFGVLFTFLSKPLIVSRMFWSELPFLVSVTLSCLFFLKWVDSKYYKYLIFSSILCGVSFFIRFSALGIILGYLIYLVFF